MLDRGSKKNVFSYFVILLSNISKDGQLSNVFGSLLREVGSIQFIHKFKQKF